MQVLFLCLNGDHSLVRSRKSVDTEYSQRGQTAKLFGINKIFLTVYTEARNNILSPSTIRNYQIIRNTRLQLIKEFNISKLTLNDIQKAVNYDSKRLSRKSVFKQLMNNNGFDITFHKLRHEFTTTLNDLGIPSDYIQKLGGWVTDNAIK